MFSLKRKIHFLYHFPAPYGGAEHRIYQLFDLLKGHANVRAWSPKEFDPAVLQKIPVRKIRPRRQIFPRGGTLVVVGCFFEIGDWIRRGNYDRVLLIHNSPFHDDVRKTIDHFAKHGYPDVEVEFASAWLRSQFGSRDGEVQISLIDMDRFSPAPTPEGRFVVGRHSRNVPEKHHPDSIVTYNRLLNEGFDVKILGGTILGDSFPAFSRPELLPENAVSPPDFLREIDCFYYRTSDEFPEAHSRAVTEAMACGLPVVAHKHGGYSDFIEHGRTGFLYGTEEEAFTFIESLKNDPELRKKIGSAARERMDDMLGEKARIRLLQNYLRKPIFKRGRFVPRRWRKGIPPLAPLEYLSLFLNVINLLLKHY
jgi:glycosyltransferase involved in cell wall biosynthesis